MQMKESLKGWAWEESVTWIIAIIAITIYAAFFASFEEEPRPLMYGDDHVQSSE